MVAGGPRRTRGYGPGEAALRAALRRWRRRDPGAALPESRVAEDGGQGMEPDSPPAPTETGRARSETPRRWWPRLTAPQVQALLSAGLTLSLLIWEELRQRFLK